jgi:hypothetical protein
MPRRKITLDEAYAVFEQHGLKVKVEAVAQQEPLIQPEELFEKPLQPEPLPQKVGKKTVRINLRTKQTTSSCGNPIYNSEGKVVGVQQNPVFLDYGPGWCYVPVELAAELLRRDAEAVEADRRFLSSEFRSYAILPAPGGKHVGVLVSTEGGFDLSGFLGEVSNRGASYQAINGRWTQ